MCKGFIRIPRRLFGTQWWNKRRVWSESDAVIDLYQQANARDRTEPDGTKVLRNQFITSNRTLADKWYWPPMKVNRFLKKLEDDGWIRVETNKFRTVITIIDFGTDTMLSDTPTDTPSDTQGDTPTDTPKTLYIKGFREVGDTPNGTPCGTHSDTPSDTYNKNIRKEEKKEPPFKSPKGYESYDLSFIDDAFREVFYTWLDYKFQRKEKYKVQASLKQCYKNLLKLSDNDPETARLVVEQSIGNNYAGLFPLKQQNYGTAQANIRNSQTESPSNQQLVADTFDLINEARAREGYDDSI